MNFTGVMQLLRGASSASLFRVECLGERAREPKRPPPNNPKNNLDSMLTQAGVLYILAFS